MAITTTNGKLAIMELEDYWEPGLPLSPGAFGQDDKQQLLWGFPEVLWETEVFGSAFVRIVGPAFRLAGEGGLATIVWLVDWMLR